MSRASLYQEYKQITGEKTYKGFSYVDGSKDFWADAVEQAKKNDTRAAYYRKYKEITGKKTYKGYTYADGSKDFWKKAVSEVKNKVVVEKEEVIDEYFEDGEKFKKLLDEEFKKLVDEKIEVVAPSKIGNFKFPFEYANNLVLEVLKKYVGILGKTNDGYYKYMLIKVVDETWNLEMYYATVTEKLLQKLSKQDGIMEADHGDISDQVIRLHGLYDSEYSIKYGRTSYKTRQGEFFPYLVNKDIYLPEWSRYGLYSEILDDCYRENCLFTALKNHDILTEAELRLLSTNFKNSAISNKYLKDVCKVLNICIRVYDPKNNDYILHNKDAERKFEICLVEGHYFINDKNTGCTKFYLNNFEEIKDLERPYDITKHKKSSKNGKYYYERSKPEEHRISSSILVQNLIKMKDKYLSKIDTATRGIYMTQFASKVDKSESLEYSEADYRLCDEDYETKACDDSKKPVVIYFDTETFLNNKGVHEAYMVCAESSEGKKYEFSGKNCIDRFMFTIVNDYSELGSIYMVAHNLGYDFRMIMGFKYMTILNIIERGNSVINAKLIAYGKNKSLCINLKDSYAFIAEKLAKFPKIFGIKDTQKEAICYDWYNKNTINMEGELNFKLTKKEAIELAMKSPQFMNDSEKSEFIENFEDTLEKWKLSSNSDTCSNEIDMIEYAKKYCIMDVHILKTGFTTFCEWMRKITGLDAIRDACTISTLADKYATKQGAYAGCYSFANHVREFIQESVVGGRVMINSNKPVISEEELQDFDGVSLYPSAMARMDGCLLGLPKIIKKDITEEELLSYDGFFVEVEITKVVKNRQFPLLSIINEKTKTRDFTNDLVGKKLVLSKTSYEDCKEFQNMEFKIIRGYYFNEGFNPKIKEVARYLFEERSKMKKKENPIQSAYKLLMNSIYGKTIEKEHLDKKNFFNSEEQKGAFVVKNHNYVAYEANIGGDRWVVKTNKPFNIHYSRPHIGSEILAVSKRIMNEVMTLAEDIGAKIYYQDTDSMHIQNDRINDLSEAFTKKYGRELVGKGLGQFHCDFDFKHDKGTEPIAIKSWFLGKKCYMDRIKTVVDGEVVIEHHIRLKGITQRAITNHKLGVEGVYDSLYQGNMVSFDLKAAGKFMEYDQTYKATHKDEFIRNVQFEKLKK